jgi:Uncharacterized protein with SCP/PR1 domains
MSRRPKRRSIVIAALSVTLFVLLAPPALASPLGRSAVRSHRLEVGGDSWKLFKATNASRAKFDVSKLQLNRELSVIARHHSMAMARKGELFHTADVDVYLDGIDWQTWGENVGFTPQDVPDMQQAFMDSPPHRSNILNPAFHQVAIGSVRVDGTLWVTVFFYG